MIGCGYATFFLHVQKHVMLRWGGVGWGGVANNVQVYFHTHTSCYATARSSCTCTHLKDRISSMSLFIPERVPELIMLFTCIVQEGRLCPHWTKVAEMGKY